MYNLPLRKVKIYTNVLNQNQTQTLQGDFNFIQIHNPEGSNLDITITDLDTTNFFNYSNISPIFTLGRGSRRISIKNNSSAPIFVVWESVV